MASTATKEYAHELIERIAPSEVPKLVGLLETRLDPVSRAIAQAPVDDEVLTKEAEQALSDAAEWSKRKSTTAHEVFLAELGISLREIEAHQEPK